MNNIYNTNKCNIYLYKISNEDFISEKDINSIYPELRKKELKKIKNEKKLKEKYYSWEVLKIAIMNSYGYEFNKIGFSKSDNGKWECDKCFFSISHSNDVIAIAISNHNVGIDIEYIDKFKDKFSDVEILNKFARRISNEFDETIDSNNYESKLIDVVKIWTTKESIFKLNGSNGFIPNKIICDKVSRSYKVLSDKYIFTVTDDLNKTNMNIYDDVYLIDKEIIKLDDVKYIN